MPRKSKLDVSQEVMEGTDTDLSLACDGVLAARDNVATAKAEQDEKEAALLELLNEKGKKSVKHGGKVFRASHQDAKDKLQIVSE